MSQHGEDVDFKRGRAIRQGVVEVEQQRVALGVHLAHQRREQACLAVRMGGQAQTQHIADQRLRTGTLTRLLHHTARDPAQQARNAGAKRGTCRQIEAGVRVFFQTNEQRFQRRAELSLAQRERGGCVAKCVHRIHTARIRQAVMQCEIGIRLDAGHDGGRAGKMVR